MVDLLLLLLAHRLAQCSGSNCGSDAQPEEKRAPVDFTGSARVDQDEKYEYFIVILDL